MVKVTTSPAEAIPPGKAAANKVAVGKVTVTTPLPELNETNINPDCKISVGDNVPPLLLIVTGESVPETTLVLSVVQVGAELPLDFNTWPAVPAAVNVVVPAAD